MGCLTGVKFMMYIKSGRIVMVIEGLAVVQLLAMQQRILQTFSGLGSNPRREKGI